MKFLLLWISACLLFACATEKQKNNTAPAPSFTTEEGEPMLLGPSDRATLQKEPYAQWFDTTYASYVLDTAVLDSLPKGLSGVDIRIFMGTWCEDSQREVPRFFKILDYLGVDESHLQIVCLDEEKHGPDGIHETWKIESVPTFVFLKDGEELGRIVEFPEVTLERDMGKMGFR